MTASTVRPWRLLPTISPKVIGKANPMTRRAKISSRFVSRVGLSNGWAELAL